MMNKLIVLLTLFGISFNLQAQEHGRENKQQFEKPGKEKIKALYVAFITQELNFNEDESEKFWPIHNQYDNELKSIHKKNLTELEKDESVLEIRKKFSKKFSKIIGEERTNLFYKKDREFRDKLIDKIRDHRMKRNEQYKRNQD